ncbi:uncharacterized protein SAMN05216249_10497 [Acetitomaculum ruminis DSM 5522]|uniref:NAD/GMP synthase domain-containing protein n=1 Tax=Acetitomaculum ruminis DSM 5522 TaxID=1120918 RepID=A0A1I0WJJ3_9FIRM|nr:ATP-dependent sacrificial sulfur transferase LarE [Acetitomaculum ruminis]SFA88398.1 uncharacterized protein SAMN05216249_10497 [Acetitomaculum ruminis DSM 5522]
MTDLLEEIAISEDEKNKFEDLKKYLKSLKSVAIAFSGGVDSTFLLKTAHTVLGNNVLAVTATSHTFPKRELNEAIDFCKKEGIRHVTVESEELKIEGFSKNPVNRCYLCKYELFKKIQTIALKNNISNVAEGSNMDDLGDYRPGLQAIAELHVLSPLRHVKLNKKEIRDISHVFGLPTWNKQSFACLSSRFAYGEEITESKLSMVDKAEQLLLDYGFSQVRVRIHDKLARIEILPSEFEALLKYRENIYKQFKEYGFSYIAMDLLGYRTGSMNETLEK